MSSSDLQEQINIAINKRVTNSEMEQNFKHCNELGINIFSTWITSFPTENIEGSYKLILDAIKDIENVK